MPGTLFIVSTPIGNLEDLTPRALRVLGEVDLIACERHPPHPRIAESLWHQGKGRSVSRHNERERAAELAKLLEAGSNIAIVSDAGTPLISDRAFVSSTRQLSLAFKSFRYPGRSLRRGANRLRSAD